MPELKNELFMKNILDPRTGRQVKKIYQMKLSKLDRLVKPMVWEYFKNRGNMPVADVYIKYRGYQLKFIYFNDPIIYTVNTVEPETENLPKNSTMRKKEEPNEETKVETN